ncbi:MAG: class I SAM-dependent methyltransferase [Candidatus Izimaplasma sp.]|nr:class I SAM-dependent methyltransferase [Candidatus Izimaplasma bacterium]
MDNNYRCKLCNENMDYFIKTRNRKYYRCPNCDSIQLHDSFFLKPKLEKARYETHNNDINDSGYQEFVAPITNYIIQNFQSNHLGLDYGAGPGPVISKVLKDHHFQVKLYDPYFHKHDELLIRKYDYIIACEVVEHFNKPAKEFELLKRILKENGTIIMMTNIYNDDIDFNEWYYKNDETHVIFYTKKTFNYIKNHYNFNDLKIHNSLIILN